MDNLYAGCTRIIGGLDVSCNSSASASQIINNLDVFGMVVEITGYLHVESCAQLPSLSALSNLRAIGGRVLYSTPSDGGYAVYIKNNAFSDLTGLSSLATISAGRVLVAGATSTAFCFLNTVNWPAMMGPNWYRMVTLLGGSATDCQPKVCSAACSCGYCVGPGVTNCQASTGSCSSSSNRDTIIIICLIVIGFALVVLLLVIWLCMTNRWGCRLRCNRRSVQWGALPTPALSTWDSARRRASVLPLTADPHSKDPFAVIPDFTPSVTPKPRISVASSVSPLRPTSEGSHSQRLRPAPPTSLPPLNHSLV